MTLKKPTTDAASPPGNDADPSDTSTLIPGLPLAAVATPLLVGEFLSSISEPAPVVTLRSPAVVNGGVAPVEDAALVPLGALPRQSLAVDPVGDNADQAVNGNAARANFGVTGAGIKIGILSDSFNVLGGAGADQADGALPAAGVTVLQEGVGGIGVDTDEGRAMAQIVHSIAPGAQLFFASSDGGDQAFANDITSLVNAGCNVIVDDATYLDEPFFQDGSAIDRAIEAGAAKGVSFFTAAGNEASNFYQNQFSPTFTVLPGLGGVVAENFGNGSVLQNVTIGGGASIIFDLQWAQPFASIAGPGAQSHLSIDIFQNGQLIATSQGDGNNGDPVALLGIQNPNFTSVTAQIAIVQSGGAPVPAGELFKYVALGDGQSVTINDPNAGIGSGTTIGHHAIAADTAVGAVNVSFTPAFGDNTPTSEFFSSAGPGEILFDGNGNPLATPVIPNNLAFSAPDGNSTSVPGISSFFGTSAAAPVVAATTALMLQADGALSSQDIDNLLRDSTIRLNGGFASTANGGTGLIQADKAVQFAKTLDVTPVAGGQTILLGTHLNDTFSLHSPGGFVVDGGGGIDTVDYSAATAGVVVDLGAGTATSLAANAGVPDVLRNIEGVAGTSFADTLISGAGGGDILRAGSGTSTLVANGANNTLIGGAGGDLMRSSGLGNTLIGGSGVTTVDYTGAASGMTVNLGTGTAIGGNLLQSAANFASGWAQVNAAVSLAGTGPDGQQSLFALAPTSTTRPDAIYQSVNVAAGTYTVSVFAKADGMNWVGLGFGSGAINDGAFFNVESGAVGAVASGDSASIQAAGNGLFKLSVTRKLSAGTAFAQIEAHSANGQGLVGIPGANGASGVLVSDAELQSGSSETLRNIETVIGSAAGNNVLTAGSGQSTLIAAGSSNTLVGAAAAADLRSNLHGNTLIGGSGVSTADYSSATSGVIVDLGAGTAAAAASNLLQSPENFAVDWSVANAALSPAGTGPDGQQSLFSLAPTSTTRPDAIFQAVTVAAAGTYTISVFAKANGLNWVGLGFGNGAAADGAFFDVATGTVGNVAAGDTASIHAVGNGLFELSVTRNLSAGTNYLQVEAHSANGEGLVGIPAANGASGVLLSDAQFEAGSEDTLRTIRSVIGSSFNDTLIGGATGGDVLTAGSGNDTLVGFGGANTLIGGAGVTTLTTAGSGNTLIGGAGTAIADFSTAASAIVDLGAGTATAVGGNQLQSPANFAASWMAVNAALSVAGTGPDGQQSLFSLAPTSTTRPDGLFQALNVAAGIYTISVFAKANGLNWIGLGFGSGAVNDGAFFNVATGTVGTVAAGDSASIAAVGNGLFELSVTRNLNAGTNYLQIEAHSANGEGLVGIPTANGTAGVLVSDAALAAVTRDSLSNIHDAAGSSANSTLIGGGGASTLFVVGGTNTLIGGSGATTADFARLTRSVVVDLGAGTATEAPPAAPPNLLQSPANFAASWMVVNAALSVAGTGPDGQQSLFSLAPTSTTRPDGLFQALNVAAGTYTISVFAKANGLNWIGLGFGNGAVNDGAFFNVATGTVGNVAAGDSASIAAVGNGLFELSVTRNLNAGTNYLQIEAHSANGEGLVGIPTADGAAGVLVSDAQFSAATGAQPPAATATLQNIKSVVGTAFNDTLLSGAAGGNVLTAGAGNDTLIGNSSGNTLIGGGGPDTLVSSGQDNTLVAGSGNTVAFYAANGVAADLVPGLLPAGSAPFDTLLGIDNAVAAGNNDTLIGGGGVMTLTAAGAGDTLIAGLGANTLISNASGNTLEGNSGSVIFTSGAVTSSVGTSAGSASGTLVNIGLPPPTLAFYGANGVTINLATGTAVTAGTLTGDALVGIIDVLAAGTNDTLVGGSGSDTLSSTVNGNTLVAGTGATVASYSGNGVQVDLSADTVSQTGSALTDALVGITSAAVSGANATIVDGSGNDLLNASGSHDTLIGGSGNDSLSAGGTNDTLVGGSGTSTLVENSSGNTLIAGVGPTVALFDSGVQNLNLGTGVATFIGTSLADTLIGISDAKFVDSATATTASGGGDTIETSGSAGTLIALGTNNILKSDSGGNTLIANSGSGDTLLAGSGGDRLVSNSSRNTLVGGSGGTSTLIAAAAGNTLAGGSGGTSTLIATVAGNTLIGGSGSSADRLFSTTAANVMIGGSGNSATTLISGAVGNTLIGGTGPTVASYAANGLTVSLSSGTAKIGASATADTLIGINDVVASGNENTLIGGSGVDTLTALGTFETLIGGSGGDTLIGGSDFCTLFGGTGADVLFAGSTASVDNTLFGGAGHSTLVGNVSFNTLEGGTGNAVLESLVGHNILVGGTGTDTLIGSNIGFDRLFDEGGNDTLIQGDPTNVIEVDGSSVAINLVTGTLTGPLIGTSTLIGATNVQVFGNNDTLTAGAGSETLTFFGALDTLVATTAGNHTLLSFGSGSVLSYSGSGISVNLASNRVTATGTNAVDTVSGFANVAITGSGDTLVGGARNNTLFSDLNANTLISGTGIATVAYTESGAAVTFSTTKVTMAGSASGDTLIGITHFAISGALDTLVDAAGTDTFSLNATNGDTVVGGGGTTVTYASGETSVNLATGVATTQSSGSDSLSGVASVTVAGAFGTLVGGSGTETLSALSSHSTLIGGAGSDTLFDNAAGNTLIAGAGTTTVAYSKALLVANLATGTESFAGSGASDTLIGITNLSINSDLDTLIAGAGNDTFSTTTPDANTFIGGSGTTVVYSGNQISVDVGSGTGFASWAFGGRDQLTGISRVTVSGAFDSIFATSGNNVLTCTGTNDGLEGGTGNDTLIGGGSGNLLLAGSGVTTLIGSASGNSLGTFLFNNGSAIVQYDMNSVTVNMAAQKAFAAGGSDTLINVINAATTGVSDTLIAGFGTNTLADSGTQGIYQYNSGDGSLIVNNGSASNAAASNELDFGAGFTDENLWFVKSGNNLQIDAMGTQQSVTIDNWFAGAGNQLQEITAGGLKLDSQVTQLVQAMATFQSNNPGFNPATAAQAPNDTALQNAIAAAWHH